MKILEDLVRSLDRCPHGRHYGEVCLGNTGPGAFDGGCLGGKSLGNPFLTIWHDSDIVGTDVHGFPIRISDIAQAANVDHSRTYVIQRSSGEYVEIGDGSLYEAQRVAKADSSPYTCPVEVRTCGWVHSSATRRLQEEHAGG